jgi:iron complex outermembrane receptor protein
MRFNVAAFYSDYKDRIVNFQQVDSTGTPFTRPANIGSATVEGFEVEVEARPIGALQINGAFGLAKFEADELPGKKQQGIPERTASLGAQYTLDSTVGAFTPRVDWAYQSAVYYDTNNTLPGLEPSFAVVNSRVTWVAPEPDWEVALSVTNLTNKMYYLNRQPRFAFGQGTVEGQPGRPREWAITVRRQF